MGEIHSEEVDKGVVEVKQGKDVLSWCRIPVQRRSLADLQAGVKDMSRWEFFWRIPDKYLLTLAGTVNVRHLREGQVLFRQGQKTDRNCYFVWAGSVSLFVKRARDVPENELESNDMTSSDATQLEKTRPTFHAKLIPNHERNSVFIGLYEEELLPEIQRVENHGQLVAIKPPGKLLGKQSALTAHRRYATAVAGNNTYLLEIPGHSFYDLLALEEEKIYAEDSVFLRKTPCFKWLDDDTLFAAAASFHRQQFVAKAEVCQQGRKADRLFLVRHGECEVLRHVRRERTPGTGPNEVAVQTIHISDLSERDMYGHWELLEDKASLFSLKTKCATEVWSLTIDDLSSIRKAGDSEMVVRELRQDGEMSMRFHRSRTKNVGNIRFGEHQRTINDKHRPALNETPGHRPGRNSTDSGGNSKLAGRGTTSVELPHAASALERASMIANRGLERRTYSRTVHPAAVGMRGPIQMKLKEAQMEAACEMPELGQGSATEEWLAEAGCAAREVRYECSRMPGREEKLHRRLQLITQLLLHAAAVAQGESAAAPGEAELESAPLRISAAHSKQWINLTTFLSVLDKAGLTVKAGGELGISVGEQLPENKAMVVFLAAARALRNRLHPPGCIPLDACLACLRSLCTRLACPIPPCLLPKAEAHAHQRPRRQPRPSPAPQWQSPFVQRCTLQAQQPRPGSPRPRSPVLMNSPLPSIPVPYVAPARFRSPPRLLWPQSSRAAPLPLPSGLAGVACSRTDLSPAVSNPPTPALHSRPSPGLPHSEPRSRGAVRFVADGGRSPVRGWESVG